MGLFDKLKQNFTHGGIKLQLQAPASVSQNDPSFTATVILTNAGEAAQTVNSITVSLVEDRSQTDTLQDDDLNDQAPQDLASASNDEPLTLQPGETKTLDFTLPLNLGKLAAAELPQNGGLAAVANVLGRVEAISDALKPQHYRHYVNASAQIEGITFGAGAQAEIQLLAPGEFGTSVNLPL